MSLANRWRNCNFINCWEGGEDEDQKVEINDFSYDYLLKMQIRKLTKKEVEKMKEEYENKLIEYEILNNKSEKDLWKEDLDNFEMVYKKMLEKYMQIHNEDNYKENNSKKKKISIKKKTKIV